MSSGLVPLLIVVAGIWWFCTIPPSPSAELPADWTPGGEAWTPEWHRQPVANVNRSNASIYYADFPDPDRILLLERTWPSTGSLEWVDIATGNRLAYANDCSGDTRYWLDDAQLLEFGTRQHDWPILRFRDRDTLQIVDEVHFRQADGSAVPTNIEIQSGSFWRRPRSEWGLTMQYLQTTSQGGVRKSIHFFATPDGLMRPGAAPGAKTALADSPDRTEFLWPWVIGTHLISFDPKHPEDRQALDLQTEEIVPIPADVEAFNFEDPWKKRTFVPITRPLPGRRSLGALDWADGPISIVEEYSQPQMYAGRLQDQNMGIWPPQPSPTVWWHWCGWPLHELRKICWQLRYKSAQIDLAAARAIRVDSVRLLDASEGASPVELSDPDLRLTAQHEFQFQVTEAQAEGLGWLIDMEDPDSPQGQLQGWSNFRIEANGAGAVMIGQQIHDPPASVTDAISIFRIGLIAPGEDAVEWLGWVPLPTGIVDGQPAALRHVHWSIRGDFLVLDSGGLHFANPAFAPRYQHQDGYWCAIPLPKELEEFREVARS